MLQIKNLYLRYKVICDNLFFVALVQIFGLIAPLITYPYLVGVLGIDLYGMVLTAQVLVNYATLLIEFGSNFVCAKNVSIHQNDKKKLSEIVSSVLITRFLLWVISFFVYMAVVWVIPNYRTYWPLFLSSYLMTLQELLFLQFFFQGIEKLKIVSLLTIIVKLVFVFFVFIFVKEQSDYLYVPILYGVGYMLSGLIALYIVFCKMGIRFVIPSFKQQWRYVKECSPILATNLVCTIKDKFNYMFVGAFVSMGDVVIYDLGLKLMEVLLKPTNVMTTVLLPRFAKNKSVDNLKFTILFVFSINFIAVVVFNIFMGEIVVFFLHEQIDLLPLRLLSVVPLFLGASVVLANNFMIGFGYNQYVFYSILITTFAYLISLFMIWITGCMNSLYGFIFIALVAYIVEFLYRLYVFRMLSFKKY